MISPITIAHLIATNFYGGPEKQIVTHALKLDASRFNFVLISFIDNGQPNELVEIARAKGIEVVEVQARHPFDPGTIERIVQILRSKRVQLLCAHGYKANVIGRFASWFAGIPQICVSRGWTAENQRIRFYEKLDRLFLRFANHIVAVSEGQKRKILSKGIAGDKVSVIHNAIELENLPKTNSDIRHELGIPQTAVFVVSAGRLSPEKNQAAMIKVAKQVLQQRDDIYFAVFGEGFLRPELEQQVKDAGLCGRFLLPGFHKDIHAIFNVIDIFILPSFTEGLPNVALEAFANKKPVVATAVGGTPEVMKDGISGFLTRPDDADLMASHILTLANDQDLREQMGGAGYEHIKTNFSFATQTAEYERLYVDIHQVRGWRQ